MNNTGAEAVSRSRIFEHVSSDRGRSQADSV